MNDARIPTKPQGEALGQVEKTGILDRGPGRGWRCRMHRTLADAGWIDPQAFRGAVLTQAGRDALARFRAARDRDRST